MNNTYHIYFRDINGTECIAPLNQIILSSYYVEDTEETLYYIGILAADARYVVTDKTYVHVRSKLAVIK